MVAIAVLLNTSSASAARCCSCATASRQGVIDALIDLPFAVSPVVIGLSLFLALRPWRLVRAGSPQASRSSSPCPAWSWPPSSCRCRWWSARSCPSWRRSAPTGAGRGDLGATPGRRSGASPCRRSAGASPTASSSPRPAPSASSARSRSSRATSSARPRRCRSSSSKHSRTSTAGAYAPSVLLALLAL